ncbi:hypothetical protein SGCOL_010898 [Colletotrichum sp. CLE4]
MRIGCLQFAPQVGDIDNNLNRADSVLSKANPDDLDLLVLPELAFSGYNFKSLQHISPFLEPSGSGITSLWARTTALKYNCNVVVGYPEKVDVSNQWPTGPEYYNSAIVVNEDGETIANYRKSFLYYTDETWALEGNQGFYEGFIPGLGHASIGICMDLNPYKFQAPWHAFEFAFHVLEYESNLVIVSMAWMTREDGRMFSRMPNEPDMDTLTYWVTRLEPIIRAETDEEIIVVFCNRTGIEDDAVYAGTSAVVGIQAGEVKIYGLLGRGEKELLVVDTNNPPYAKLVYRPEPNRPSAVHSELQETSPSSAPPSSSGSGSGTAKPPQSNGTKQGFSTHTPTQPKSAPSKHASSMTSSKKSPSSKASKSLPKIKTNGLVVETRNSASRSPGFDGINLPTPTAPSPTPLAIRPRIQIPQSPPLEAWQASPIPLSSQSTQSFHSVLSNQSVTSNGRAPADSTPYPDSAHPLSGYPTKMSEMKIYGGHVSIAQMPFSPITPLDDQEPLSPRYFWRPSDNFLKTPMETRGRMSAAPDSPVERHGNQQHHQFPSFSQPDLIPRSQSSNTVRTTATVVAAIKEKPAKTQEQRQARSMTPKSRSPSKSRTEDESKNKPDASKGASSQQAMPPRPSSTKSRHASRSRVRDQSESAVARREQAAAISQHLESVAQRAESVNRSRAIEKSDTPVPDRPSSPKSRNCSRSRPTDRLSSILIAASPSILSNEFPRRPSSAFQPDTNQTQTQRPMSRMGYRPRAGSAADTDKVAARGVRNRSRTPISDDRAKLHSASRTASRGRQPGAKFSPPKMSPREHSRSREPSAVDSKIHGHKRRASAGPDVAQASKDSLADFEIVEEILCPNCPVHGRQSIGSAQEVGSAKMVGHRDSPDLGSGRSMSLPAASAIEVSKKTAILNAKTKQDLEGLEFSSTNATKSSDALSLTETLETVSTTSRSPSTPMFEPKTPTAMVFVRSANDSTDSLGLDATDDLIDLRCMDRDVVPVPISSGASGVIA